MTDTLRPVEVSEYYINRVASGMSRYFWDNIFSEIFDILKDATVFNSKDDVINAIRNGKIWYEKGAFRTKTRFSNNISKTLEDMGAKFKYNAYYIPENLIPIEYSQVLGLAATQTAAKANEILSFLGSINLVLTTKNLKDYIQSSVELMYRKLQLDILQSAQDRQIPIIELGIVQPKVTLPKAKIKPIEDYWKEHEKRTEKLNKELDKARKERDKARTSGDEVKLDEAKAKIDKLTDKLTEESKQAYENAPKLDLTIDDIKLDAKSKKIAEDYTYNMQYWVKNWEAKNIALMRQDVLKMVQQGARVPRLQEYFERRWKGAKDKAHFLAVNESHLAASVIKATEYQNTGSPGYVWGRSASKEKRKLHEQYYGKFFTWEDKPPLEELKIGKGKDAKYIPDPDGIRGYPRQIWNCKCHMLIKPPTIAQAYKKVTEVKNAKRNIFKRIFNSTQCDNNSWRYRRFGEG